MHIIRNSAQKEEQIRFHYKAMKVVVRTSQECELKGFAAKTSQVVERKCVLILMKFGDENQIVEDDMVVIDRGLLTTYAVSLWLSILM